jgi:putative aldouronate transport system permease protein
MKDVWKRINRHDKALLVLIMLPGILHFLVFRYIPLLGNVIAFQNYNLFTGILESKWVGFEHFRTMLMYPEFLMVLRNTLVLSLLTLLFGFPAPLLLALLLNEVRQMWFKRPLQTMMYLPHFLSWVIVGGIFITLFNRGGMINNLTLLFSDEPINFILEPAYFRFVLVFIGMWKEVGWGTILYLAAMAGINPHLYEAAVIDGAGRFRQMWSITIPCLMPTIVVLFLLNIGNVLESNTEQVLIFLNPLVREVGDVINTYVYRVGLLQAQFSYTTAIGLFQSVVGLLLVFCANWLSRRTTGESLY